jgi:TRAP-type mannitol/chloroaromatic compound transport system permease small subunit
MEAIFLVRRWLTAVSQLMAYISGYGILAVALLVTIDVVMRKLGISPINGSDEISGYALAVLFSWSCSYALFTGSHLRVDVFYRLFPVRMRAWHDVAAAAAFLVLAFIFAWAASGVFMESLSKMRLANTTLRTPLWIPQALWALGFAVFLLSALTAFIETLLLTLKGDHEAATQTLNPPVLPES